MTFVCESIGQKLALKNRQGHFGLETPREHTSLQCMMTREYGTVAQ
jgi:hypothetical protein